MSHAEVAKLIAANLHQLPHPKHNELRLMGYRPTALHKSGLMKSQISDETHAQVDAHGQAIGEGIVELIERNGKTIVDAAELKRLQRIAATQQESGPKIARGYCAHCGHEILRLNLDGENHAKLHRLAIEGCGIPHNCWDRDQ